MDMPNAIPFADADRYLSYLKTPLGRLRSDLAWENLRRFLPAVAARRRALDLGGGTGWMSLRMAELEFDVVLVDGSEEMLRAASAEAEARGMLGRISLRRAEVKEQLKEFEPEFFEVVVCHNLLEFVARPEEVIAGVADVMRNGGLSSFFVRNRGGAVVKAAVKSRDMELARAALSAETVADSLYGARVALFDGNQIADMLRAAGLQVIAEFGVRVLSDYRDEKELSTDEAYGRAFKLELILGTRTEFAGIARYSQLIAGKSSTPERREEMQ
jgi:S-adenosylmethionine-dependent methyltransferase